MAKLNALVPVLLLLLAPSFSRAQTDDGEGGADLALRTLGLATAVSACWQAGDSGALADVVDGCQIWQQPGVALVIMDTWHPAAGEPDLWLGPDRTRDFLRAQAELRLDTPVLYPRESEAGADGLDIEPAVYLLNAEQAQQRLTQYLDNLDYWIDLNPGAQFIVPSASERRADAAVVFLDGIGPLEFYFQLGADGALKLIHVIHYDFFSA
jgi:hypothetical protein